MRKKQCIIRKPITVHINAEAKRCLRAIEIKLLNSSLNRREKNFSSRDVSQGKIIETLLTKEDAQEYVERILLNV